MSRALPGTLEWQAPLCMMCGDETEVDSTGYACGNCEAYWPSDATPDTVGEWDQPNAEMCGDRRVWVWEHKPPADMTCILHAGHDHRWHIGGQGSQWDKRCEAELKVTRGDSLRTVTCRLFHNHGGDHLNDTGHSW